LSVLVRELKRCLFKSLQIASAMPLFALSYSCGFFLPLIQQPAGLAWFIFYLVDDGTGLLTHHLLAGFEGSFVLALAYDVGCRLVEAKTTSRTAKL
jgi:hypothetical protein